MDQKELEETAELAHLKLTGDELSAALPAFEQMLEFFAAMQGAGTEAAADIAAGQAAGARLVGADHFRGDAAPSGTYRPKGDDDGGINETMLDNAGERDGRFIVIPNVL
ncbi:MAG: aspartyl/glutamyl-tRNA amidotransferase subunit C [Treponema sp.]|jgi:aspartyl-tRNA(Asn)/glutamyl-tRNA(Gln) amidotransferase subunit C|nr:aspartyl/glutamyl-tRNA amidotransferase subunit C [Treponema sp.]